MYPAGREPKRVRSAIRARPMDGRGPGEIVHGRESSNCAGPAGLRVARRTSMPAKQTITSIKALRGKEIAKGVTIKPLVGDHVMLNYVELVPEAVVALHSHHHEQLGLIIEGEL